MIRSAFSPLPDSIIVAGNEYKINTDFRVWIKISDIICDQTLCESDKLLSLFMLAFKNKIPQNPVDAVDELMKFISKNEVRSSSVPVLDFRIDEGLIYAAFMQQYGIDLYKTDLHWWKFRELLNALSDDCMISKVIRYRSTNTSEISDKKYRAFIKKMKKRYSLKNELSCEQIAAAFE